MIPLLLFPILAAAVVWLAGRRDPARDPRLTTLSLCLLALFPLLLLIPKLQILPAQPGDISQPTLTYPWLTALRVIWISGVAVGLVKLALSGIGLRGWLKRSILIERLDDGIELRLLDQLHGPVAAGVFHKVIYVPTEWSQWDEDTQITILHHELAHHRRHDPLVRWIGSLLQMIHWFNPLVHWMIRRLALQCEQACDQQVILRGVASAQYAELLCRFASDRSMPAGALAMAEKSSLELRIRHLVEPKSAISFISLALLALITVGGATVLAISGSQNITRETPDHQEVELRLTADPFPADHL
jgi:beta-lactamase regulating signal transducer with metallopeptidase domain